jgi:hypothetical protein
MKIEKIVLEKSAEALLERAEDCFDLATAQHKMADEQHEVAARQSENANTQQEIAAEQHAGAIKLAAKADELETLGSALVAEAVEIKGDTQVAQRGQ